MKCPRCQHENRPGAKFCEECATPFPRACSRCGTELAPTAKFCPECAHPTGTAVAAPAAARFGTPETYTPKHLADRILTSRTALEGERKQVTVLFADLKGSMELLADRDPEEARKLLDPVLERMMEAVHRYEGTVNQVMGDGIMALFGAPLAHEDHAVRACYAALRMQDSVNRYAEDTRRARGVNVQIRIGLNSGEVVVRAIGSDLHMDYTAVGQMTHLAARMEQLANPGSILLTPATLELVEGYVAVRPLGPVRVKGLADAVEVYEVTGAGPARTRIQAGALRGLTRFVGRDAELAQLRRAQQLAGTGHGQVAAIVGEGGVGKSRLVYEFIHSHRVQGWLTLESASVSYGKPTSYLPVIDLLKGYFKIQDRDHLREIREKVTGKLLTLDRALEPTLPALLALLDVPGDDAAWQSLDPEQRRQRTLDAVRRLLLREAREHPLLLIIEDLHWIDGETQGLLDGLVDNLGSARLLLLVNYRPEYQHAWGSKTYYSQLRLDVLAAESVEELLEALLGDDPGLARLKQLLFKRGNPFFLEETVRMLVETQALGGERGRYQLTKPVQAIEVPSTVQVMLAARIDRLSPEDKRLLQVASVIGKDVPFALLQLIAELPDEALRRGLHHLQAAEFLYETGLYPDLEYSFKHALTHEVTYRGLLQDRRRELHARIVGAIEMLHRDRLGEQTERLAHHALRGELREKAVHYLRQAGMKALARSAYTNAAAHLEQGIGILGGLPETPSTLEQAIDLRLDLRNALVLLADAERSVEVCDEAARLAEKLGDSGRVGWAWAIKSGSLYTAFRRREAVAAAERACQIALETENTRLWLQASLYLGVSAVELGDFSRAEDSLTRVAAATTGAGDPKRPAGNERLAVIALGFLAISLAMRGNFAEATRYGEDEVRLAESAGLPNVSVLACIHVGRILSLRGEFRRAAEVLERGHAMAREWNLTMQVPGLTALLGFAHTRAGRSNEGGSLLREAMSQLLPGKPEFLHVAVEMGEALALLERIDDAHECVRHALHASRHHGERPYEASALRLLGDICLAGESGEPGSVAATHYREAGAIASELGLRPLAAHCNLGLAKFHQRTGSRAQAREHLITAARMYGEMDMRYWLEQAKAEAWKLEDGTR